MKEVKQGRKKQVGKHRGLVTQQLIYQPIFDQIYRKDK